jgi:hypothetical protein
MRVERTIEAQPAEAELRAIVEEAARAFDLRAVRREGGGWLLRGGTLLSADPHAVRVRLSLSPSAAGLVLAGESAAFPGTAAKIGRLLEARVAAVEDLLRARLRGRAAEEPTPAPRYRLADPGWPGAAIAAGWIGASSAAALAAAFVACIGLGCVLVGRQRAELVERTPFIQFALDRDPLPSAAELGRTGPAEVLGAALIFAVPCGLFVGLAMAGAFAWSEIAAGLTAPLLRMIRDLLTPALVLWGLARYAPHAGTIGAAAAALGLTAALSVREALGGTIPNVAARIARAVRGATAAAAGGWLLLMTARSSFGLGWNVPIDSMNYAYGAAIVLGATFAGRSVGPFAVLFLCFFVIVSLVGPLGPAGALAFGVTIPLAGSAGYLFVWGRRREKREERTREQRDRDARRAAALGLALAAVAVLLGAILMPAPGTEEQAVLGLARFRDRFLMNWAPGRALARFYYRHTLLAAELQKPITERATGGREPYERLQRSVLLLAPEAATAAQLRREGFYVTQATPDRMAEGDIARALGQHPYDLIITRAQAGPAVPGEPLEVDHFDALRRAGRLDRTIVLAPAGPKLDRPNQDLPEELPSEQVLRLPLSRPEQLLETTASVARKRFEAEYLRQWTAWGWLAIYYGGGALAAAALLLPPAALLGVLFRRASRRTAIRATAAIFIVSTVVLALGVGPSLGALGPLAELRALDPDRSETRTRLAGFMESSHPPDVRYEAVFRAFEWLDRSRRAEEEARRALQDLWTRPVRTQQEQKELTLQAQAAQRALAQALERHAARVTALKKALQLRLRDPDLRVRVWSVGALGRAGSADGPDELMLLEALLDPAEDFFVRYRAAEAIGDIGTYAGNRPDPRALSISLPDYRLHAGRGSARDVLLEGTQAYVTISAEAQAKESSYPVLRLDGIDPSMMDELRGRTLPPTGTKIREPRIRRSIRDGLEQNLLPALQRMQREQPWYAGDRALRALRRIWPERNF